MSRILSNGRELDRREHNLYGGILYGIDGMPVELQARFLGEDEPGDEWRIKITGMAGGAVREVQSRIQGVFAKYGLAPLKGDVLINLAPAGIPKYGTSLDLPIAMICLQAAGYAPDLSAEVEKSYLFIGELSLHGEVRRINGALPIALCVKPGSTLVVPEGNQKECCCVRGLRGHEATRIVFAHDLEEVLLFMRGKGVLRSAMAEKPKYEPFLASGPDFASVKGQYRAKRAMLIAAAGGHNALMVGPPGEGKSLLASALPSILPQLTNAEKIELTKLYSAKGLLSEDGLVVSRRPFRSIHHTASKQSLVGGGSGIPEPGEITLAHHGVLFLDELAEFSRGTLESLRQPIESGVVTVSRVDGSLTFPSRFTLIAAMNPCPCGFYGQYTCEDCLAITYDRSSMCPRCGKTKLRSRCDCKPTKVAAYRKKVSGPILDRIDLHVDLRPLSVEEKFSETTGMSSAQFAALVAGARQNAQKRFVGTSIPYNAAIPGGEIRKWCVFQPDAFDRYKAAITEGRYSTRATDRMAKVARTLADLDSVEKIETKHVDEAASFLRDSPLA